MEPFGYNLFSNFGNEAKIRDWSVIFSSSFEREDFFNSGETCAVLKDGGEFPLESDMFTTEVIRVTSMSIHDFSSGVGIGSRSHDLFGAVIISRQISSSEAGENTVRTGRSSSERPGFSVLIAEMGKEDRMREILSTKNEPNVCARATNDAQSGSFGVGQR